MFGLLVIAFGLIALRVWCASLLLDIDCWFAILLFCFAVWLVVYCVLRLICCLRWFVGVMVLDLTWLVWFSVWWIVFAIAMLVGLLGSCSDLFVYCWPVCLILG